MKSYEDQVRVSFQHMSTDEIGERLTGDMTDVARKIAMDELSSRGAAEQASSPNAVASMKAVEEPRTMSASMQRKVWLALLSVVIVAIGKPGDINTKIETGIAFGLALALMIAVWMSLEYMAKKTGRPLLKWAGNAVLILLFTGALFTWGAVFFDRAGY